jgi:hypothetical protein
MIAHKMTTPISKDAFIMGEQIMPPPILGKEKSK